MPTYYTHDNGGRPFKVAIQKLTVNIYKDTNKDNVMTSETLSSSSSSSSSNHLFVVVRGSGQFLTGDGSSTGDIPITNLAMQVIPFFEKNINTKSQKSGQSGQSGQSDVILHKI